MKTYVTLPLIKERTIPRLFSADDIRYPESLVRYFLSHYMRTGDRVLDPLAGLGTTPLVAKEMGCIPYGIERDRTRYEYLRLGHMIAREMSARVNHLPNRTDDYDHDDVDWDHHGNHHDKHSGPADARRQTNRVPVVASRTGHISSCACHTRRPS